MTAILSYIALLKRANAAGAFALPAQKSPLRSLDTCCTGFFDTLSRSQPVWVDSCCSLCQAPSAIQILCLPRRSLLQFPDKTAILEESGEKGGNGVIYHILAIGDVVGEQGLDHLARHLRSLKQLKDIHFTVVNGENASVVGITPQQVERLYQAGADVVTLGNHTFGRQQLAGRLEEDPYLLRPANFTGRAPGRGWGVYECRHIQIGVMNLIGRCGLDFNADNPFTTADKLLRDERPLFTLVDFHAEATSEKLAMGYYLDGRVSALWGTHTHVPTADGRVMPKGTGYLTDLGMTGPVESVLGICPEQSIEGFLGGLPGRYQAAEGPCKMQGAVFSLDSQTGLCVAVEPVDVR